jgi:hypothetical protein
MYLNRIKATPFPEAARITVYAKPPVQYRFQDLHVAFSAYLDAVVAMLRKLSEVEVLRR